MNTNLHVKTRLLAPGIAAALLAALPASASAADYCVAPKTGCGANDVATLEQALDLADDSADPDRVLLGATTYEAPGATGFQYFRADAPVEIAGQGTGQTVLTAPAGAHRVLYLNGGDGTSVHDLTLRLPQNVAPGSIALRTVNLARSIEVVEDPTQTSYRRGIDLEGGTLEDSTIALDNADDTTAVLLNTGGGTVRGSVLSARRGVASGYGGTIERSRLTSVTGITAARNALQVRGSLIRFGVGEAGTGVSVGVQSGYDTSVSLDGVTLVGSGLPGTVAGYAGTFLAPDRNAALSITNSIVRGAPDGFKAATSGSGQATVALSWSDSDFDPGAGTLIGANASITATNVSNLGDAGFADAAGGDYRLLSGSPLIDAGDPTTAQGLDLGGAPLVADGNGDGTARRDLGAFELQPAPAGGGDQPPAGNDGQPPEGDSQTTGTGGEATVADTVAPLLSGLRVTRRARLRYLLSEQARVTLRLQRAHPGRRGYRTVERLGRNGRPGANSVRLPAWVVRPGRYRVVAIATDAAGNRSARRSVRFRVTRG